MVVPEGLLPRFIVQTHTMSEGLPRWRTGVIVKYEVNWALIRADLQQRRVLISVDGPVPTRRHLLSIIRANFNQIHRDLKGLNPSELVPLPGHPDRTVPYRDLVVLEREESYHQEFVINEQVEAFDVRTLLNGVDTQVADVRPGVERDRDVQLFLSYSHRDERYREEMTTRLKTLQRHEPLYVWSDRSIGTGEDWRQNITEHLNAAHVILLLVSPDFLSSDFCYGEEMRRALELHDAGAAVVVPILIRPCRWEAEPFARLQVLPRDQRPLSSWGEERDRAWLEIETALAEVVSSMRSRARS